MVCQSTRSLMNTERLFKEAYIRGTRKKRITTQMLRLHMRIIAYHEAGHVVARMFTGTEFSHVVRLSIIPKDGSLGRETTERCTEEATFEICPETRKQSVGKLLLITLLAGRGAIAHLSGHDHRFRILDTDDEEWAIEGSDLFRAHRIAKIMAGADQPAWPLLQEAEQWTTELMDMPMVWKCVKRLADRLVKHGTIEGDAIMDCCDEVSLLGITLPEWRRRLYGVDGGLCALQFRQDTDGHWRSDQYLVPYSVTHS